MGGTSSSSIAVPLHHHNNPRSYAAAATVAAAALSPYRSPRWRSNEVSPLDEHQHAAAATAAAGTASVSGSSSYHGMMTECDCLLPSVSRGSQVTQVTQGELDSLEEKLRKMYRHRSSIKSGRGPPCKMAVASLLSPLMSSPVGASLGDAPSASRSFNQQPQTTGSIRDKGPKGVVGVDHLRCKGSWIDVVVPAATKCPQVALLPLRDTLASNHRPVRGAKAHQVSRHRRKPVGRGAWLNPQM